MNGRGLDRASVCLRLVLAGLVTGAPGVDAKPPTWTSVYPAGVARGQTVLVTASGTFDHWPPRVWVDRPGLAITPGKQKGKLTVVAAADAVPGVYRVRLWDSDGATALRAFMVGNTAEPVEIEPNDDPREPRMISALPVTINGRLAKNGDVDGFAVLLEKGQTLVADLIAQRELGSPMDAVLQVVSSTGFVLAQNDDTCERDPRLVFEAPARGRYVVRVFAFPASPTVLFDSRVVRDSFIG